MTYTRDDVTVGSYEEVHEDDWHEEEEDGEEEEGVDLEHRTTGGHVRGQLEPRSHFVNLAQTHDEDVEDAVKFVLEDSTLVLLLHRVQVFLTNKKNM